MQSQALLARQSRMARLGYYTGPVDGDPGPRTEAAYDGMVAALEKSVGMKPPLYPRLDPAHAYLRDIPGLPQITVQALLLLGTVESPGTPNSPVIMAWAAELNLRKIYSGDAVPWCGLFAAICAHRAGKEVPEGPLFALNWRNFGTPVEAPMLGDIMVWQRSSGGGHVNQYVGESTEKGVLYYHGIGGNQSDQVNIMRRRADVGLVAVRRPIYRVQPESVERYAADAGTPISTKES